MNNTTTNADVSIGYEIARQIGNRAFFMMGAAGSVCATTRGLTWKIKGCKAWSHIKVTLTLDDEYTVSFFKFRGVHCLNVKDVEGMQVDQLHSCISDNTGLALSL